jgi:predicted acyl esterase
LQSWLARTVNKHQSSIHFNFLILWTARQISNMGDMGTPTTVEFKGCQVPLDKINPPTVGNGGYAGFNPRSEVLPAGWKYDHPDAHPLASDILVEHDVAITMRDGAKLYADIYRPPNTDDKVPALIMWSPFGKKFNGLLSLGLMTPWSLGIKSGTLSGLEKFEALDPADWVPRGYAIVNVDTRGTGDSDGHMVILGTQEAEDGYDTIEAVAKLPWCTGSIGLAGNSHLAIAQWFIAAQRPPSLKAIAPFEGCGDLFREQFARGGIYAGDLFDKLIVKYMLQGKNGVESFRQMFKEHPLANEWWNDKRPNMKNINIPTYITGTWTNTMHGMGAIRAWLEVDSKDKWLRWHPWQEWADLWGNPQARDELFSFFDHYLRGVENDWLNTPRVRMAVLRFGNKEPQSYENVVEEDFPLPRTEYKKLYFADRERLSLEPPTGDSKQSATYSSADGGSLSFTHRFDEDTSLVGMPKAVLWMSCDDHDDMDIYVLIEKLDKDGKPMMNLNIPWKNIPIKSFDEMTKQQSTEVVLYKGPLGILRASHRAIDEEKSMHPHWPFHPHEKEEKIAPGTVVRLDIGIWAMGIEYEAGESLRVSVSGRNAGIDNFGTNEHSLNRGTHRVHFDAEHPSHVVLPFV